MAWASGPLQSSRGQDAHSTPIHSKIQQLPIPNSKFSIPNSQFSIPNS
ncbi:MAG: hypothetical protein F6J94_31610 [Moorea sp. SIO1F2]|nr:hypothetical protein [Moorena sp. SIO1F2]NET86255.1 hypothetical protein [Moorena sp. SIO1F2]